MVPGFILRWVVYRIKLRTGAPAVPVLAHAVPNNQRRSTSSAPGRAGRGYHHQNVKRILVD